MREFTPKGQNALHCSAYFCRPGGFEQIKFLIEELKMDINEHGRWQGGQTGAPTFFMCAVANQKYMEDDFEVLEYLISRGADVNSIVFNVLGGKKYILYTLLSWEIQTQQIPKYVIDWLIHHGAKRGGMNDIF